MHPHARIDCKQIITASDKDENPSGHPDSSETCPKVEASFEMSTDRVVPDGAESSVFTVRTDREVPNPSTSASAPTAHTYESILRPFALRRMSSSIQNGMAPQNPSTSPSPSKLKMLSKLKSSSYVISSSRSMHSTPLARFSLSRWLRRNSWLCSSLCWCFGRAHISPSSWFSAIWLRFLCLVYAFQLFYWPVAPVFLADCHSEALIAIDIALELMFLIDIALIFNTAINITTYGRVLQISSRKEIAKRYLQGWFVHDLVSSLPLETVSALIQASSRFPRPVLEDHMTLYFVGHLLRLGRLRRVMDVIRRDKSLQALRSRAFLFMQRLFGHYVMAALAVAKVMALWTIGSHYATCLWHMASSFSPGCETRSTLEAHCDRPFHVEYIIAYRDTIRVILSGSHFGARNDTASIDCLAMDVVGIGLLILGFMGFAVVAAYFSMVFSGCTASTDSDFARKIQRLNVRLEKLRLPSELQARIYRYYSHLWSEYGTLDSNVMDFTQELTQPLALEVGLCRFLGLLMRVPIWDDCSADFLSAVVRQLQVRVYLSDDYLLRKGEYGSELLLLQRGVCEQYVSRQEVDRFSHGSSIGELALIMDYVRISSVRAVSDLEVCVLPRAVFQRILSSHAAERRRVVSRILRRALEANETPVLWNQVHLHTRTGVPRGASECQHPTSDHCSYDTARDELSALEAAEVLVEQMNLDANMQEAMLVVRPEGRAFGPSVEQREYTRQRRQLNWRRSRSSASSSGVAIPSAREGMESSAKNGTVPPMETPASAQDSPLPSIPTALEATLSELKESHAQSLGLLRSFAETMERVEGKVANLQEKLFELEDAQSRVTTSYMGQPSEMDSATTNFSISLSSMGELEGKSSDERLTESVTSPSLPVSTAGLAVLRREANSSCPEAPDTGALIAPRVDLTASFQRPPLKRFSLSYSNVNTLARLRSQFADDTFFDKRDLLQSQASKFNDIRVSHAAPLHRKRSPSAIADELWLKHAH